jgi:pyridoxine 5-phosphate synthase
MTKLSVNINKIATLRNARGGVIPDVLKAASDIESFGADGITVHPRPDERHIRYQDVHDLKAIVTTELNIEGYPSKEFIDLVLTIKPEQVTLVPDPPDVITSNAGWNTIENSSFLKDVVDTFKSQDIRTSLFIDPNLEMIRQAPETGTDRIELYTESYAANYISDQQEAIRLYVIAAQVASELGLGINAGHDLNLQNLKYFVSNLNQLDEVSIGHALISDALYLGLENAVRLYKRELDN